MSNNQVAPHEIIDLHELLNSSVIEVKKGVATMGMIKDEQLKSFMQESLNNKKNRIQELQNFINNAVGSQSNNQGTQNSSSNNGNNQSQ